MTIDDDFSRWKDLIRVGGTRGVCQALKFTSEMPSNQPYTTELHSTDHRKSTVVQILIAALDNRHWGYNFEARGGIKCYETVFCAQIH